MNVIDNIISIKSNNETQIKSVYLRSEINPYEFRTPLTPNHAKVLISNGWEVWVQSSNSRIYKDQDYEKVMCKITKLPWFSQEFSNSIILGLKQFDHIEKLNSHTHIYFSHSYQNQLGFNLILSNFYKSSSVLYDLEYFINKNNQRLTSFGFWAGIVGCGLALIEHFDPESLRDLKPYPNSELFFNQIKNLINIKKNTSIGIIGHKGNCGQGVCCLLNELGLNYNKIQRYDDKSNLVNNYNIIINCIKLNSDLNEIWFDSNTKFITDTIICDVSCDYTKPNNPIKLYNQSTTWTNPVYIATTNSNYKVKIISIDNLPSLLPKESSDYFSNCLTNILLDYPNDQNKYFHDNYKVFLEKLIK